MKKHFIKASNDFCGFENYVSAPYLRRRFLLDFAPEEAKINICGLGFYRLYINGHDITKGHLAPYISNPDHYCYYDDYDVRPYLQNGENVVGILLGNGFFNPCGGAVWDFDKVAWRGAPRVALEFVAKSGEKEFAFYADEKFLTHDSPIYFDEIRMGEYYDSRKEIPGWNRPGFDDTGWNPALPAEAPRGELKKCNAEPILPYREIKAEKIIKTDSGYIYDFGINSAGVCRLKIRGSAGQKISMRHGELIRDGKLYTENIEFSAKRFPYYPEYNQKNIYIARGGEETWTPSFTYEGFRYVQVEGIEENQATDDLLTFLLMSSSFEHTGDFACSDETVNRLFAMAKNSALSNFYYFPTDCPHREKNGWTGDAALSAEYMTLLFDTEKSYSEWLCNIRKSQNAKGALPGIVPTDSWGFAWGNGPAWDKALFELTYVLFKYRGNIEIVKENAHSMMRYLDYITSRRNPDGTVAVGLGDYLPIDKKHAEDYDMPIVLSDSIMVMDMAKKAALMFEAAGFALRAEFARNIRDEMRESIRKNLLDKETCTLAGKCQSSQALGLYYGIFEENEKGTAFAKLLEFIEQKNGNFDCGILGINVIFHVLSDFGEDGLAYRMITKKEYPSFGSMIERGATALMERFYSDYFNGSHNHHFLGDIARWFIQNIGGLKVENYNRVTINPKYDLPVDSAQASHILPSGKVSVSWRKQSGKIYLEVICPSEIECEINEFLPNSEINIIRK